MRCPLYYHQIPSFHSNLSFVSKDSSWGGVIEEGTTIPEEVIKELYKSIPIKKDVQLDQEEKAEKIELSEEKNNDEVANQKEKENRNKAREGARSLRELSNTIQANKRDDINQKEERQSLKKAPKDNQKEQNDEIDNIQ